MLLSCSKAHRAVAQEVPGLRLLPAVRHCTHALSVLQKGPLCSELVQDLESVLLPTLSQSCHFESRCSQRCTCCLLERQ